MNDATEEPPTAEKPKTFERHGDPEGFLEVMPPNADRQRRKGFFRSDVVLRLRLQNLCAIASTLCEKEIKENNEHSARMRGLRRAIKGEEDPKTEPLYAPTNTHVNIAFDGEITTADDVAFGLISEAGPEKYNGRIAVEIRPGPEAHSQVSHYAADSGSSEALFICIYLSHERLEWLHRERLARPHLVPVLRATIKGFKEHDEWSYGRTPTIYVEPETATIIANVSFVIADTATRKDTSAELSGGALLEQYKRWMSALRKEITDESGEDEWKRCAHTFDHVGYSVTQWCVRNAKPADQTVAYLGNAEHFLKNLATAIHDKTYPFTKLRGVWQHVHNFTNLVHTSTPSQRKEFAEDSRFTELLDEYIRKPSLQNTHLDWLFLDLIVTVQCIATYESYMGLHHGMGYVLCEGVRWKMFLWKLFMRPLGFVIGWVLPGVGFYYLAQWISWLGIGLAVIYYGFSAWMLVSWLWSKIVALVTSTPSPKQVLLNRINQIDKVYPLLAPATIHVPTVRRAFELAQDNGASFDQRLFYILDQVLQRSPQLWQTAPRFNYQHLIDDLDAP